MKKKKWLKTWEQTSALLGVLRNDCIKYIKRELTKHGGKIDDETYSEDVENEEIGPCFIEYDGGRHPEYDSNTSSQVYGVYKDEKGKVYIEIEDTDEYEITRVTTLDLVSICYWISQIVGDNTNDMAFMSDL